MFLAFAQESTPVPPGPRGSYLERLPIEVPWGMILGIVGLILIVILVSAFLIKRELKKIDPNAVLRDNGNL